jgi:very-short-patch-repair endonuclease
LLQNRPPSERAAQKTLEGFGFTVIPQYKIKTRYSTFYVDLYLPELKLCIEIDGGYHFTPGQRHRDKLRSAAIRRSGLHLYRLKAADVYSPRKVAAKIKYFIRRGKTAK